MVTAPSQSSGVVGAVFSMSTQLLVVVALAIQAGMFSVHPGGISNRSNIQLSFYVELGWINLWLVGFVVFYRVRNTWATKIKTDHELKSDESSRATSAAQGA